MSKRAKKVIAFVRNKYSKEMADRLEDLLTNRPHYKFTQLVFNSFEREMIRANGAR